MSLQAMVLSAVRRGPLVLAVSLVLLVSASPALAQDPPSGSDVVVVPPDDAGPGPAPAPDPAPAPEPASSGGGGGSSSNSSSGSSGSSSSSGSSGSSGSSSSGGSSSSSTFSGGTATPPPVAQPSAEELARRQAEARKKRQEALRKKREQERKRAARLAKAQAAAEKAGFEEFLRAWSQGKDPAQAPAGERDRSVNSDAATPAVEISSAPAAVAGPASHSSSRGVATPVLLGLLALAILLLGLAALPSSTIREAHLAAVVAHRRLEIGLLGTAVLASAAIGLLVIVVGG
jgi:hypothetical protein